LLEASRTFTAIIRRPEAPISVGARMVVEVRDARRDAIDLDVEHAAPEPRFALSRRAAAACGRPNRRLARGRSDDRPRRARSARPS
jgi:hypothetical protein